MKTIALCLLLAVNCLLPAHRGDAPPGRVKILRFEVDGKDAGKDFKVTLYVDGAEVEQGRDGDSFVVPPAAMKREGITVRFRSGEYDLVFDSVHTAKFEGDWIIGIDRKPFDQEHVEPEEAEKLELIYYITFVPKGAAETRLVIKRYK